MDFNYLVFGNCVFEFAQLLVQLAEDVAATGQFRHFALGFRFLFDLYQF